MRTFRSKNPGSKKGIIMRVDYFGKKKSVSDDSSSYAGSVCVRFCAFDHACSLGKNIGLVLAKRIKDARQRVHRF